MAKRRVYSNKRYSQRSLMREREYGFYWYSWLWGLARPLMIFLCSLLIVCGLLVNGYQYVYRHYFMPMNPGETTTVNFEIASGSSVTGIGRDLVDAGLLRNRSVFKYMVMFQGLTNKIHYGDYQISPGMGVSEIIEVLTSGSNSTERTITIIPGWTVADIADYLLGVGAITDKDAFLSLCNDASAFQSYYVIQQAKADGTLSGRRYALEGYLAPDTYRVFTTATAEDLLKTLLDQTDTVLNAVYDRADVTEDAYATSLTRDQTIVLASIIEKEGRQTSDFAKISAVFHNRIAAGMRLESDATVKYVLKTANYALTSEQLAVQSPYNTYVSMGLPPGAICNPSKAALDAALHPDELYLEDGYLYFCAGDPSTKETIFSKTLEEHNMAVSQFRPLWEAYDKKLAEQTAQ